MCVLVKGNEVYHGQTDVVQDLVTAKQNTYFPVSQCLQEEEVLRRLLLLIRDTPSDGALENIRQITLLS